MVGIVKEISNSTEMRRAFSADGEELIPAMTAQGEAVAIPAWVLGSGLTVDEQVYLFLKQYAEMFFGSLLTITDFDEETVTVEVGNLALVSETTDPYDSVTIEVL